MQENWKRNPPRRSSNANTPRPSTTHQHNQENRPQDHDRNPPTQRSANAHNNNNNLRTTQRIHGNRPGKTLGQSGANITRNTKKTHGNMVRGRKWETRQRQPRPKLKTYNRTVRTSRRNGKGNGQRLYKACKANSIIPMNTWKRPKLHKQEKEQTKQKHKNRRTQKQMGELIEQKRSHGQE